MNLPVCEKAFDVEQIPDFEQLKPEKIGPFAWFANGASFTRVEPSVEVPDAHDIVAYDCASGRRTVLVPARSLVPPGETKPLTIDGFTWSPDGSHALLFTNAQRVWRDATRGDYWVFHRATGTLQQLGKGSAPSSLLFAKFSPDGSRVAYVTQQHIFVEAIARDGSGVEPIVQLTHNGDEYIINGTSDWAYEEELHLRDCFRWSPDSKSIAYVQFDVRNVGEFAMIDNSAGLYPEVKRWPYPKVGTTNATVRLGIIPAKGGETLWLDSSQEADGQNNYIARFEWVPDTNELIWQVLHRDQQRLDVRAATVTKPTPRVLLTETDSAWVQIVERFHWLDGNARFLWMSERDGWRHLYVAGKDENDPLLITPGAFDVIALCGLDAHFVYFIASPDDATRRYLYRTRLDGKGDIERITPAENTGTHAYEIAPNGAYALHTYSTFDNPPISELVQVPSHRSICAIVQNAALRTQMHETLAPFAHAEFFTIAIDNDVELGGWMLKPANMQPGAHYPLVVYVYGEPASSTVVDAWSGQVGLWHRYLVTLGYVVVSIDNRGTAVPKGRAWRKSIYGAIGVLSAEEQAAAVRRLLETRAYLDPQRVGAWGHSGGGSNTLHALFRFPDLYKVGIVQAPMADQRLYNTIYQERYMGTPHTNPEGFRRGSPITYAEGLQGKLLLIHGSADDNCHLQVTERLIDRLIELNKPFDCMIYPNRSHSLAEGPGTTMHLYSLMTRYFTEHLPAGPQ